jgi:hypothetical protein
VRRQSLALAERLLADGDATDGDRIRSSYRLTLGREPTAAEVERALTFIAEYEAAPPESDDADPGEPEVADTTPIASPKAPAAQPANPDDADQSGEPIVEAAVRPKDARTAAWLAFAQALFGSAEFRYIR